MVTDYIDPKEYNSKSRKLAYILNIKFNANWKTAEGKRRNQCKLICFSLGVRFNQVSKFTEQLIASKNYWVFSA